MKIVGPYTLHMDKRGETLQLPEPLVANDSAYQLQLILYDSGAVLDLTGKTVRIRFACEDGWVGDEECTVTDAAAGAISYHMLGEQLYPGEVRAIVSVYDADELRESSQYFEMMAFDDLSSDQSVADSRQYSLLEKALAEATTAAKKSQKALSDAETGLESKAEKLDVGDKANLNTTEKTNLVSAINEVAAKGSIELINLDEVGSATEGITADDIDLLGAYSVGAYHLGKSIYGDNQFVYNDLLFVTGTGAGSQIWVAENGDVLKRSYDFATDSYGEWERLATTSQIGTLSDLTTINQGNLVAAINEVNEQVVPAQYIGDMDTLATNNKAYLVDAINEVAESAGTASDTKQGTVKLSDNYSGTKTAADGVAATPYAVRQVYTTAQGASQTASAAKKNADAALARYDDLHASLSNLATEDKSSLVTAINELHDEIGDINTILDTINGEVI